LTPFSAAVFGLRIVRSILTTSDQSDPVNTELKPLMLANAQDFQMNGRRLSSETLLQILRSTLRHPLGRHRMLKYIAQETEHHHGGRR
jgi:hypothetical protein